MYAACSMQHVAACSSWAHAKPWRRPRTSSARFTRWPWPWPACTPLLKHTHCAQACQESLANHESNFYFGNHKLTVMFNQVQAQTAKDMLAGEDRQQVRAQGRRAGWRISAPAVVATAAA